MALKFLSASQRRRLARKCASGGNRPPATKLEHAAFAPHLFDCWRLITGAEPGKNLTPKKNPSLVYVNRAWVDVFRQNENRDDDPQFIGALRIFLGLSAKG